MLPDTEAVQEPPLPLRSICVHKGLSPAHAHARLSMVKAHDPSQAKCTDWVQCSSTQGTRPSLADCS